MSDCVILSTDNQCKAIQLTLLKLNDTVDGVAGHTYLKISVAEFSLKFKNIQIGESDAALVE